MEIRVSPVFNAEPISLPEYCEISDRIGSALKEFSGRSRPDFLGGPTYALDDHHVREMALQRVADLVPGHCFPCWESVHVLDVSEDDIQASEWVMLSNPFPSPGEDECESGAIIFANVGKTCSTCGRSYAESGHVSRFKWTVLSRKRPVIQMPNDDVFCIGHFIQAFKRAGLTGMQFLRSEPLSRFLKGISTATCQQHQWTGGARPCAECRAMPARDMSHMINTEEQFAADIEEVSFIGGRIYVVSVPMFHFLRRYARQIDPIDHCMPIRRGLEIDLMEKVG